MKKMLALLLLLGGCSSPINQAPSKGLAYLSAPPLKLAVGSIEVSKLYVPPEKSPHVDHLFAIPPVGLVQQWIQDHLVPAGTQFQALVTIEEASVIETPLKKMGNIKGLFTTEQSERYDGRISVKIEIIDPTGRQQGFARATVTAFKTAPENANIHQRKLLWTGLLEDMMNRLNEEIERNIQDYLPKYIVR